MANLQQTGGGGGGGTTLTGTGIARNTGACTELSGDVTTSGSNAASVVKVNGAAVPASKAVVGTNSSSQIIDATATTLPTAMFPALTGDATTSAGSLATSVVKVNGASVPTSATILGSNGSGQLVDNSSSVLAIKSATITLSTAQILALNTTSVQILAAPGAGLANIPMWATYNYVAGGTAYSGSGTIQITQTGKNSTLCATTLANAGMTSAAANGWNAPSSFNALNPSTLVINQNWTVWCSTANPTLGNGSLKVTLYYYTVAVS